MEAMMGGFDDAALRDFNRQSSQVAPGHRLLTYRESRFWSGSLPNMGKMPCSVIVVRVAYPNSNKFADYTSFRVYSSPSKTNTMLIVPSTKLCGIN
jgi:hypothetical protein